MPANLSDLQDKFKNNLIGEGKAQSTVIAYCKDIEQLLLFLAQSGKTDATDVTAKDLDAFKADLKKKRYTGKSISRKINSVKSFFRYIVAGGTLEESPAEEVVNPKYEQTAPRVLSRLEYRALRDACRSDIRIQAVVELLLQTGMRISELAALQLVDVDLERSVITIRAQGSRGARKVPLNVAAKNALTAYLQIRPRAREKTLFLTKTCRPFLVRNIRTSVDRFFKLAGIRDAKLNDLRHTFIVEQLKAGTPLVYVSQLVGHKRITTTEKYMELIDEPQMEPSVQIEQL